MLRGRGRARIYAHVKRTLRIASTEVAVEGSGRRPADIDAPDWITLFDKAVKGGVFTDNELASMAVSLSEAGAPHP